MKTNQRFLVSRNKREGWYTGHLFMGSKLHRKTNLIRLRTKNQHSTLAAYAKYFKGCNF